jgi:CheY-like chemotaxis protein
VIHSEPGLGTTVKLLLPRAAADAPGDAVRHHVDALPRGSERILVVEDDALVRAHVTAQLGQLGYQVVSVGDARAALVALTRDGAFDLLFTDIVIPGGLSGTQLAEEARRRLPGLRVLFTSGYTEEAILNQGVMGPGARLLAKPYHRRDLAQRVRETLGSAEASAAG